MPAYSTSAGKLRVAPTAESLLLWRASRWWTAAIVVATFPFVFILDQAMDLPLSPVLPGIGLLLLAILTLPVLLVELQARRYRKLPLEWRKGQAQKFHQVGRVAFGAACVWLLLWLMAGI